MTKAADPPRSRSGDLEARYHALTEIGRALIQNLNQETILESIAEWIAWIVPFDRIGLMVYEPERDSRRIFALTGPSRSRLSAVGTDLPRSLRTYAWRAFDERRPVLADLGEEASSSLEKRLYREGLRSVLAVPLFLGGKGIGTLNVASRESDRYARDEVTFLEEAAHQVALAIGNIRSNQEIAVLRATLKREADSAERSSAVDLQSPEIVGTSSALKDVLRQARAAAGADCTVLITGETGTGKELIARLIHSLGRRKNKPFVGVNCSALPGGLVESELFGHEKGAFTGATARRVGRFELAEGGTLFLDEIGDIAPDVQVKLLRVLQEREFERLGGAQTLKADVRLIAATNRDLAREMVAKRFRADLFYRLSVFPIAVPPLRDRGEDISLLLRHFVVKHARKAGKPIERIREQALERLRAYDWPGNIRELENLVERAVILAEGPELDFPEKVLTTVAKRTRTGAVTLEEVERSHIEKVLEQTHGVVHGPKGAAKVLGLNPSTLRSRMKKLGVEPSRRDMSQES